MPSAVALGLVTHPEWERPMKTVPLSRDFLLWLYRDRTGLTWQQLERQPPWRTERDLAYLQLEGLAEAWRAAKDADDMKRQAGH